MATSSPTALDRQLIPGAHVRIATGYAKIPRNARIARPVCSPGAPCGRDMTWGFWDPFLIPSRCIWKWRKHWRKANLWRFWRGKMTIHQWLEPSNLGVPYYFETQRNEEFILQELPQEKENREGSPKNDEFIGGKWGGHQIAEFLGQVRNNMFWAEVSQGKVGLICFNPASSLVQKNSQYTISNTEQRTPWTNKNMGSQPRRSFLTVLSPIGRTVAVVVPTGLTQTYGLKKKEFAHKSQ